MTRKTRKKLNYAFFWINLIIAFIFAYQGSFFSIFSFSVSFFCWCAYRFEDQLDASVNNIDDNK